MPPLRLQSRASNVPLLTAASAALLLLSAPPSQAAPPGSSTPAGRRVPQSDRTRPDTGKRNADLPSAANTVPEKSAQASAPDDLRLSPSSERRARALEEFANALLAEDNAETEKALAGYRRALDADPSYTELALKVAFELLQGNDAPAAIQVLKDAAKAAPKNPAPVVFLAQVYDKHLRKPELAAKFAEQALTLDPEHLPALATCFEVYAENGLLPKAEQLLERLARSKSPSPQLWIQIGELQARLWLKDDSTPSPESKAKMDASYRRAAENAHGDPEVLGKVADYFVLSKQIREAAALYESALASKPATAEAASLTLREKFARTLLALGQRDRAVSVLETIVQDSPMRMETQELLGEIHEQSGHPEKALRCYQQLLLIDPGQPRNHLRLAEAALRAKKPDLAVATMREARNRFPDRPEVLLSLGMTLSQAKQHTDALAIFAEALDHAKSRNESLLTPQFFFQYGAAAEQAGELDKAAQLLEHCIELDPANAAQARNYLGYMWADRGLRLQEALLHLEKAVESDSDNGAYLDSLGWCLFKLGDHERALRELLRASEKMRPEDPVVLEHIGDVYQAQGKAREALLSWERALELDAANSKLAEKIRALRGTAGL